MQENYDNDTRGGKDLEVIGEMVAGGDILPAVIQNANLVMQGLIMPLLTVLGLAGNILSIMVLHSQGVDMKVTFRRVLTMLAVFDCILISSITVSFSVPQLSTYWRDWIHPYIFPWTLPFIQISLNGSILSTVSVTMERYVSVVHPRHWIRTFSSAIYIVPVVLVTVFWNVTRFGELETCYREMNVTDTTVSENLTMTMEVPMMVMEVPMICPTSLRTNLSYIRDYILIANFFVMGLLPFCLLAILNYKLYKTIKDSGLTQQKTTARQKRDQKIASLLILLVLVFGCCNVVRIITNLYEVFHMAIYGDTLTRWPAWCDLLTFLSHLLLVFNSSSNIVIYCWKDEKFRKVLFKMLGWHKMSCLCAGSSSQPTFGSPNNRRLVRQSSSPTTRLFEVELELEEIREVESGGE